MNMNPQNTLDFVPFEHYMALDDSPEFPMNILWRLCFEGQIERKRFYQAFGRAIERHPLLRSKMSNTPDRKLSNLKWVTTANPEPPIIWREDSWSALVNDIEPIDLQKEISLKAHVLLEEKNTKILFQFHHSATDGKGAASFLEDLLHAYHGDSEFTKMTDISHTFRDHLGLTTGESLKRIPREIIHAGESIMQPAKPLATPGLSHKEINLKDDSFPFRGAISHKFDKEQFKKINLLARSQDATINDLVIREFFLAMNSWNVKFGGKSKRIRVTMPINLRFTGSKMPASNIVSMCFLNRSPDVISDEDKLLKSIKVETQYIRKHRMGLTLIRSIKLMSKLSFGYPYNAGGDKACHSTGVLTNLGIVFKKLNMPADDQGYLKLGRNLKLVDVSTFPPLRPNTHVTLGLITYGNTFQLCLSYNKKVISQENARSLLEHMTARLSSASQDLARAANA
jgi:NRPS condensation-like uncharacterized protein